MTTLTPCLWFDTEAQDAANFYLTVFPNSRITDITYYGEAGPRPAEMVLTGDCPINGVWGPAVFISEWFSRTVRRRLSRTR